MVLHRLIGSPEIMREQLAHMAELAQLPHVSVQIVPASAGAHAGLAGAFTIATTRTGRDVMYIEAVEGRAKDKVVSAVQRGLWELPAECAARREPPPDLGGPGLRVPGFSY